MGNTFYTSDLHFRHKFVSRKRGFGSPDDHDEAIIERWNKAVTSADQVWVMGDVGMWKLNDFAHLVKRLNGEIHVVLGNHDEAWPGHRDGYKFARSWMDLFASIQPFARKNIDGTWVLLSHFPYKGDHTREDRYNQFRLRDEGEWLVHGHIHQNTRGTGRQIHVGLEAWDLRPVPQQAIKAIILGRNRNDGRGEGPEALALHAG